MPTFRIYPALREDMNEGWVWIGGHRHLDNRCVVKLTNPKTSKYTFCEVCHVDDNFVRSYNKEHSEPKCICNKESAMVISEWYRKKLEINDQEKYTDLEIYVEPNYPFGKLHACLEHPQNVVRVGTWLGIIGVALGLLSLLLTDPIKGLLVEFFKSFSCH